ncbi:MAG: GHKL domain-containing protein [Victivallales bacterium]|nr:GHKL domain-containing protein [Victivallales bacterium]
MTYSLTEVSCEAIDFKKLNDYLTKEGKECFVCVDTTQGSKNNYSDYLLVGDFQPLSQKVIPVEKLTALIWHDPFHLFLKFAPDELTSNQQINVVVQFGDELTSEWGKFAFEAMLPRDTAQRILLEGGDIFVKMIHEILPIPSKMTYLQYEELAKLTTHIQVKKYLTSKRNQKGAIYIDSILFHYSDNETSGLSSKPIPDRYELKLAKNLTVDPSLRWNSVHKASLWKQLSFQQIAKQMPKCDINSVDFFLTYDVQELALALKEGRDKLQYFLSEGRKVSVDDSFIIGWCWDYSQSSKQYVSQSKQYYKAIRKSFTQNKMMCVCDFLESEVGKVFLKAYNRIYKSLFSSKASSGQLPIKFENINKYFENERRILQLVRCLYYFIHALENISENDLKKYNLDCFTELWKNLNLFVNNAETPTQMALDKLWGAIFEVENERVCDNNGLTEKGKEALRKYKSFYSKLYALLQYIIRRYRFLTPVFHILTQLDLYIQDIVSKEIGLQEDILPHIIDMSSSDIDYLMGLFKNTVLPESHKNLVLSNLYSRKSAEEEARRKEAEENVRYICHNLKGTIPMTVNQVDRVLRDPNLTLESKIAAGTVRNDLIMLEEQMSRQAITYRPVPQDLLDDVNDDYNHNNLKFILMDALKRVLSNVCNERWEANAFHNYFKGDSQKAEKVSQEISDLGNRWKALVALINQYFFTFDCQIDSSCEQLLIGNRHNSVNNLRTFAEEILLNAIKYVSFVDRDKRIVQFTAKVENDIILIKLMNSCETSDEIRQHGGSSSLKRLLQGFGAESINLPSSTDGNYILAYKIPLSQQIGEQQ